MTSVVVCISWMYPPAATTNINRLVTERVRAEAEGSSFRTMMNIIRRRCDASAILVPSMSLLTYLLTYLLIYSTAWLSGGGVTHINEFTLRQARLVLGWVTVSGFNFRCGTLILVCDQPPR